MEGYKLDNLFKNTDDKLLFAKVLDKLKQRTFTDFLDPMRCASFMQALERIKGNVIVSVSGGYKDAERKMIGFDADEFPITPIKVMYNQKFSKPPSHRDYLGSVLGLGLDRGKIGDICLTGDGAVVYVCESVVPFLLENLTTVGRTAIKVSIAETSHQTERTGISKRVTVASMRLDAILSTAFNLSRGKAATLIEAEKVLVNWKLAKKTQPLNIGDKITVRGMGRISIDNECGSTKKDRTVLEVTINK